MIIKKHIESNKNTGYYFPMFNLKGFRSSITPFFGGDVKTDLHHYATEPTSELGLFEHTQSRNVIFDIDHNLYFLNGQTQLQQNDSIDYEVGPLYQKVNRHNKLHDISTTSFVLLNEMAEVHEIVYTNKTKKDQHIKVTTATPMYARSVDNLHDHRHVTSLLNTIDVLNGAIKVKPTLSFDERGHQVNDTTYYFIASSDDMHIKGYIPTQEDYLNQGSFHFPKGLDKLKEQGYHIDGYEAMGGIAFDGIIIKPNESVTFYMAIAIQKEDMDINQFRKTYLSTSGFHKALDEVIAFFETYLSQLKFEIDTDETSKQLNWVSLQPLLRRYYGNSFMPHHDYGKGGRGWRDLWQDLLALIMMNDDSVYELLYSNFQGVRIDGSNATIIGDQPGEFKADRNQITRVWSDHGVWPLITTKLYIDETGDVDFLLKEQSYFSDQFTHYTRQIKKINEQNILIDENNKIYKGSILEHLLIENLVGFHNIGKHGFTRLEDADWNDGLDMAHENGETIAFTHMYAENLSILAHLLKSTNLKSINLLDDIEVLLTKNANLQTYFDRVSQFKGNKVSFNINYLFERLMKLSEDKKKFINDNAYEENKYQSYYDKNGELLDDKTSIALTGQAMALIAHTPTQEQAQKIAFHTKEKLFDTSVGGYHLNTNYQKVLTNMGRAFGFAYNHKENGAVFAHMAMMYAYGLYEYNLVDEARQATFQLLKQAQKEDSQVLAGIPEYFSDKGHGKYSYLTGSASWLLLLLRKQIFGLEFNLGKLTLNPKLTKEDFINQSASIVTNIFGKTVKITYHNPKNLDYGQYKIKDIFINDKEVHMPITKINGSIEVHLDEIV
ncbi:GH36-type glycosyl hydrolase domain-containing protein [Mariniplasma anaerobium]|uniref:Glycosyl transferase n=1 Tax=Mariniplasma anaerobium TaxID=2735436 RepID=A0A7U9TJ56_9MOLU|nr:cellobiose phosphorylase [Mariniplasma anaerobium]BCR35784.1 glycosyl transferase [Mariniplasma anaerobium]